MCRKYRRSRKSKGKYRKLKAHSPSYYGDQESALERVQAGVLGEQEEGLQYELELWSLLPCWSVPGPPEPPASPVC